MKVRLTVRNRIDGEAGDIVEVSPDRAVFLIQNGGAVKAETGERNGKPETRTPEKPAEDGTGTAKAEPEPGAGTGTAKVEPEAAGKKNSRAKGK